jgi:flagellar biosynthesis/type III secretory pathway protein FliH
MPEAIAEPLTQLSFEIASRLTANASMERAPFVAAVQEALMRLPRPGENLYLRLRAEEVESWKKIVDDPGLPFNCTILVDADVRPGHAYVEVSGARIDVGQEARLALVRHALGLEGATEINSTADELPPNDTQLLGNTSSEPPTLDPDLPADELDPPPAEKE